MHVGTVATPFLQVRIDRVAGGRLTREVLRSHAKPVGAIKRGQRRCLRESLTSVDSTDGAYGKWIHRFGQHEIRLHIDEILGLEAGTYDGKRRNTTRI
jgi:hypothetical protein